MLDQAGLELEAGVVAAEKNAHGGHHGSQRFRWRCWDYGGVMSALPAPSVGGLLLQWSVQPLALAAAVGLAGWYVRSVVRAGPAGGHLRARPGGRYLDDVRIPAGLRQLAVLDVDGPAARLTAVRPVADSRGRSAGPRAPGVRQVRVDSPVPALPGRPVSR